MAPQTLASIRSSAAEKLEKYTAKDGGYAFNTYDIQEPEDGPLKPSDVLMANLLSLQLSSRDVIPLFMDGNSPAQQLREALDNALIQLKGAESYESYESFAELQEVVESLIAANMATASVKWWTAVTVSKVLHRRRPHIVPLIDSRVREFYGARTPEAVRMALWQDIRENRGWMSDLAATKATPDGRPLSVLRLADILIWTP